VPADEATLVFTFSTPVTLDVVRKAITASPRIRSIGDGYLSGDGTEYKVTADLDTETDYKIKIGKLVDSFGQELAKPQVLAFRTGNALPRLSMERGIFALEATAKGYPVWSRNVGKFDLECAAIPKERIVTVLTTDRTTTRGAATTTTRTSTGNRSRSRRRSRATRPRARTSGA
jgi:hypothetical protein